MGRCSRVGTSEGVLERSSDFAYKISSFIYWKPDSLAWYSFIRGLCCSSSACGGRQLILVISRRELVNLTSRKRSPPKPILRFSQFLLPILSRNGWERARGTGLLSSESFKHVIDRSFSDWFVSFSSWHAKTNRPSFLSTKWILFAHHVAILTARHRGASRPSF